MAGGVRGVNNTMHALPLVRVLTAHIPLQCPRKGRVIPLRFHMCFMTQDGRGSFGWGAARGKEFLDH